MFAKQSRWHSCKRQTVDDHLHNRPRSVRELYDLLAAALVRVGPYDVNAVKSKIYFTSQYHIVGSPPDATTSALSSCRIVT